MSNETWKWIPGWEGYYEVSSRGRIRGHRHRFGKRPRPRISATKVESNGYVRVRLCKNNRITWYSVHRAVVLAFIGTIPRDKQVRHLNGEKTCNVVANLAIGSPKENGADTVRLGKHPHGERHGRSEVDEDDVIEIRSLYKTGKFFQRDLAERFGVCQTQISKIILRKSWKHL